MNKRYDYWAKPSDLPRPAGRRVEAGKIAFWVAAFAILELLLWRYC